MKDKVIVPADEAETTINYSKYHIGDWAEVFTTDKNIMKRFEKFCAGHPEYGKLLKEDKYSMTFSVHPKCASLYPRAPRKGRIMTEEEKTLAKERLHAGRMKTVI